MNKALRAILLGFDGTIAETEWAHRLSYNRAFAMRGFAWSWDRDLYRELATAAGSDCLRYYLNRFQPDLHGEMVTENLIDELHDAKIANFINVAAAIPFRPGIQRLIYEACFAKLPVAIVTRTVKREVDALLAQDSAVTQMIDVIAADDPSRHMDRYQSALEQMAVSAQACIAIEASQVGLACARDAGIMTIIAVGEGKAADDFLGAATVLSTLGDVDVAARAVFGPVPANGTVDLSFLRALLNKAVYNTSN